MPVYETYNDIELAGLLRLSDEVAFRIIYKKYWDKLLAAAGRRLKDQAEAEEALQDIFLNLWRRRETFNLRTGFDQYFAVALKFEVINRLAKLARETSRNENYALTQNQESAEAYERLDFEHLQKQLEHTISTLPPKCQLVFRMSREQDLTNKQIAAELDISEKAVEKHMTSALKTLRTRFGQYLPVLLLFLLKR